MLLNLYKGKVQGHSRGKDGAGVPTRDKSRD